MSRWALFLALFFGLQLAAHAGKEDPPAENKPETQTENPPPGYVFGVTVSSAQELDVILNRADSLRKLFDPDQHGRIAIVLHGDELQLFHKDNYAANQSIVERARLLDEEKVIDIKACQTKMRFLEIDQSELPGFIEQVPFAPVEIERLEQEHNYTRL
jgi:intracellular sulfur oxidation DsrE/DsrF family protein